MLVNAAMAMMSVAAVDFYLRFLVALFKEYAHQVTGYRCVYDLAPAKTR